MRHGARARHGEEGQALVEFALTLPILLLLMIGLVDVGRGLQAYVSLGNAVREAAREAAVHGADATTPWGPSANDANVTAAVRGRIAGIVTGDVSVTSSWPSGSNAAAQQVVVSATYTFKPVALTFLGGVSMPFSATTRAWIQH